MIGVAMLPIRDTRNFVTYFLIILAHALDGAFNGETDDAFAGTDAQQGGFAFEPDDCAFALLHAALAG